jgi:hypothetical protein
MGAPAELVNEGVIQMAGELALSPTVLPIPGASRPQASPTPPQAAGLDLAPEELQAPTAIPAAD